MLLLPGLLIAQNQHLAAIDMDYLNMTKDEIKSGYEGFENYKLVKDEPGYLVYEGGECFLNWPIQRTEYYFSKTDTLYKINLIMADRLDEDGKLYKEIIKKFNEWFGLTKEHGEREGEEYYYWDFTIDEFDFHNIMYVTRAKNGKSPTIIMQADYKRLKKVENGK